MRKEQRNYKLGINLLSKRKTDSALEQFGKALDKCSIANKNDLQKILYYTGIALKRKGFPACAYDAWCSALELHRMGNVFKIVSRISQPFPDIDEDSDGWPEFYIIQLRKYLMTKKSGSVGTIAEQDMINDLIYDCWNELKESKILDHRSYKDKLAVFYSTRIIFPEINPASFDFI